MARRAIFAAIAWICLSCAGLAQPLSFPTLTGRVVDEAGLLDERERAALTDSLAGLEAKTTDQFVVATLKSLQGMTIEDYGYQLGRHWQIGQKDKNNGVLLIVAAAERKVRIEVGYGLEGTLTDGLTKYIIETSILPQFKAGNLPGGIKSGAEQIIRVLGGDGAERAAAKGAASDLRRANGDTSIWPILVVVLIGVGVLVFCMLSGGAFCRGALQILFLLMLSGRRGSSRGGSSFSGGGGSFGGGGSSGSW